MRLRIGQTTSGSREPFGEIPAREAWEESMGSKKTFQHLRVLARILLIGALLALGGCRMILLFTGLGETIEQAETGSPEAVLQDALAAALIEEEGAAWRQFKALIHPEQMERNNQKKLWRTDRFPRLRRQVDNYVLDKSIPSFNLVGYKELKSGEHVLSIENAKSESGTPCTFALHEGAFYIKSCSL